MKLLIYTFNAYLCTFLFDVARTGNGKLRGEIGHISAVAMESEMFERRISGLAAGVAADGRLGRSAGVLEVAASLESQGLVGSAGGRGVDVDGGQVGAHLLVNRVAHLGLALQRLGQLGAQSAASFTRAQLESTNSNMHI